jgi:hypothetical protein
MRQHGAWIAWVGGLLMVVSIPCVAGQSARQGDTSSSSEKTSFGSPMILETVFAAADRSLWEPSKGHAAGEWFSTEEYKGLGRFSCDGVYLRSDFSKKQGTWKPGLAMSVREAEGGQLRVKVRATIDNPADNHDRKVDILFEVMNGDKVIATASDSSGMEEGDEKNLSVTFTLPAAALIADPMTKLRLTVKTARD